MSQLLLVEPLAYWQNLLKPPLEAVVGAGNVVLAYNLQDAVSMLNRDYAAGIFSSDMARMSGTPIEQRVGLELADRVAAAWNGYKNIAVIIDNPDMLPEVLAKGITRVYGKFKPKGEMRKTVRHWIHLPQDLRTAKLIR